MKRAGVVSQSTQMIENVQEIMSVLMEKFFDLRFVNTICFPTRRNHEQIKRIIPTLRCDDCYWFLYYANSKRLTQLALERNREHIKSQYQMNWMNLGLIIVKLLEYLLEHQLQMKQ